MSALTDAITSAIAINAIAGNSGTVGVVVGVCVGVDVTYGVDEVVAVGPY